jgi:hypothetical protein
MPFSIATVRLIRPMYCALPVSIAYQNEAGQDKARIGIHLVVLNTLARHPAMSSGICLCFDSSVFASHIPTQRRPLVRVDTYNSIFISIPTSAMGQCLIFPNSIECVVVLSWALLLFFPHPLKSSCPQLLPSCELIRGCWIDPFAFFFLRPFAFLC